MAKTRTGLTLEKLAEKYAAGQVKLNSYGGGIKPAITNWVDDVPQVFQYGAGLELSSVPTTTNTPSGPYPIYDQASNNFLEDPLPGQATLWRVIFTYSNKAQGNNLGLTIGFVNVDNAASSFIVSDISSLPSGTSASQNIDFSSIGATANTVRPVKNTAYLLTIADSFSIGTGYKLFGATTVTDNNLVVEIDSVTKVPLGRFEV